MKKYLRLQHVTVNFCIFTLIIIFFILSFILTGCSGSTKTSSANSETNNTSTEKLSVAKEELKNENLSSDREKTSSAKEGRSKISAETLITAVEEITKENHSAVAKELTDENLSTDQKRLTSMFGYPDQFLIMFDENNYNSRIDVWTYSEMETIFIFEDGTFDNTEEYYNKVVLEDWQEVFPDNFIYAMTPDDVKNLILEEGAESIDEITGLKVLTFSNGDIICVFNPYDELIIVSKQLTLSEDA